MNVQTIAATGMLDKYIQYAKVPDLEHHLESMRGTENYKHLKKHVERIRNVHVKITHGHARMYKESRNAK